MKNVHDGLIMYVLSTASFHLLFLLCLSSFALPLLHLCISFMHSISLFSSHIPYSLSPHPLPLPSTRLPSPPLPSPISPFLPLPLKQTPYLPQRNLHPSPLATTAELVERIKANLSVARNK
jgi:hypothetical protein